MVADISSTSYTAPKSPGTSISNKYWCTYLVIDSYNLANHPGLSRAQAAVASMIPFWKSSSGFKFLDYYNGSHQNILSQVQPGYSIMFQDNPGQATVGEFDHAAIVKSINLNSQGDGTLVTYDSNLPTQWGKTITYPVAGWEVKGTLKGPSHPNYSVMGFGTIQ
jgi:hypothetical protein